MSGKFLRCSKGVTDPLEFPVDRCDFPGDASAEMGLISPGGENLLDFLELRQVLSTYDRDLRDSVADVSRFPSWGSRDLWLSLEAFPRGFPTGLSHVPPWCEWILGLKVEAVQGKQVPLKWTETYGGLFEWWHDPGVPLAFPIESPCS